MKTFNFTQAIKKDKFFMIIIVLSLFSLSRSLYMPLHGDEITYLNISKNILKGKFFLGDYPSTVVPTIPFLLALFATPFLQSIGIILLKCFFILLTVLGFRYLFLFLQEQKINIKISITIVILTLVNPISILGFPTIYPEALLFFSFWGFIYYFSKEISLYNFKIVLLFFMLLIMTRYVNLVLGLLLVFYYYRNLIEKKISFSKMVLYSVIYLTPFLLWIKYVYHIEANQLSKLSYFTRFEHENPLLYNIKCGLGLVKADEVNKINGVPAFISLFVPITGLRNYVMSIILLVTFILGYVRVKKTIGVKLLLFSIVMVMLGFVFAGTGFSRYWLMLLPGFYLGFYFLFKSFKLKDEWFILGAKVVSVIYVINELRLDYLIFNKY